jgi:hypothetical protein
MSLRPARLLAAVRARARQPSPRTPLRARSRLSAAVRDPRRRLRRASRTAPCPSDPAAPLTRRAAFGSGWTSPLFVAESVRDAGRGLPPGHPRRSRARRCRTACRHDAMERGNARFDPPCGRRVFARCICVLHPVRSAALLRFEAQAAPSSKSLYTTAVHMPRRCATIFTVMRNSCGPGSGANSRTTGAPNGVSRSGVSANASELAGGSTREVSNGCASVPLDTTPWISSLARSGPEGRGSERSLIASDRVRRSTVEARSAILKRFNRQKTCAVPSACWCPGAESNHRHGDFQSPVLRGM